MSTVRKNIRVLVATPFGLGGKGGVDRLMNVLRKEDFEVQGIDVSYVATRGPRSIFFSPLYLTRFLFIFVRLWRRGQVDVVHLNVSQRGSTYRKLIIFLLCRVLRIPYVVHLHDGRYDRFWSDSPWPLRLLIDAMFTNASSVVVLGCRWYELVTGRLPLLARKTKILPNVCERQIPLTTALSSSTPTILFTGAINKQKGVPTLIAALQKIRDCSWKAVIAGDGDIAAMRTLCASLDLSNRVVFTGWVDSGQLRGLLASSSIFVLPSLAEGMPMSVVEAMAAGLAIVTTPVGGVPDIITHGENGLLTVPGDPDDLALALRRLVGDCAYRRKLAASAYEYHSTKLDVDKYCHNLGAVWRNASETIF